MIVMAPPSLPLDVQVDVGWPKIAAIGLTPTGDVVGAAIEQSILTLYGVDLTAPSDGRGGAQGRGQAPPLRRKPSDPEAKGDAPPR
jgi:hypothetical protein